MISLVKRSTSIYNPACLYPYIRQIAYHNIPVFPILELVIQDDFCFWLVTDIFLWYERCCCVIRQQFFLLYNSPNLAFRYLFPRFHQLFLYFVCAIIITVDLKNLSDLRRKHRLIRFLICFIRISTSVYLQDAAHCWYRVFVGVCLNHIYFHPKISAACFKMSFPILSCWFSLRSWCAVVLFMEWGGIFSLLKENLVKWKI